MTPISIPQMKYVVQCFISDRKGISVKIADFTQEQLSVAYQAASNFYNGVLPCPDNGRFDNYTK